MSSDVVIGDQVRERALAYVRTIVPIVVGSILAWLGGRIPPVFDFLTQIEPEWRSLLATGLTGLVIIAYYWVARQLGKKWPRVETLMLGSSKKPVYVLPEGAVTVERTAAAVNQAVKTGKHAA
jgi:hypothetical protein